MTYLGFEPGTFEVAVSNVRVYSVGVPQCVSKTFFFHVDLTRIFVESTRSMVQLATQRADSTRKAYLYSHAFVSNQRNESK
jgi:hypothetical protein